MQAFSGLVLEIDISQNQRYNTINMLELVLRCNYKARELVHFE